MRLLLTADWHLSDNPRDGYRFGAVAAIEKLIIRHKIRDLYILGDLCDFPDHHSAAFTNRVVDLLAAIAKHCAVTILRGNHDGSDPSVPFFRFVNAIPRVRFIVEAEVVVIEGTHILLVPHGQWPETGHSLDRSIHMIFTHHTFAGAVTESGKQLPGLRLPMLPIPIYSGDIHVPSTRGKLTYVGAPTLIDFGDSYDPRVVVLDARGQPHSTPIRTPGKRLVEVMARSDGALNWRGIGSVGPGDLVKVRVSFSGQKRPPLSHLRANIDVSIRARGATLYSIVPEGPKREAAMPTRPATRDDRDLVRQYATTHRFDPPTVEAGLAIVGRKGE